MRTLILLSLVLFQLGMAKGQTSLKEIDLKKGGHNVGFKHFTIIDSTRTYRVHNEHNNRFIYRPIPISLWYPALLDKQQTKPLTILDYLEVLKEEEEWKNLPNEFLLDWFPYLGNTQENQHHLSEETIAFLNSSPIDSAFPVIVYAPSYQASSIENFALFEYLASHGFVVISSPSRGTETRWLEGGTTKDMVTQSRDVELLLKEIYNYDFINVDQVALMGFSFGGIANALTVMKNKSISALISLDGTEKYNYPILEKSPYFNLDKLTIPYINFAQKDIPEEVLKSEKIPLELNYKFQFFDSLKYSNAKSYKFHDLTHSNFSSLGVLFATRDKRQDKSDAKIMASYQLLSEYNLQFLKATLKNEEGAKEFIENTPVENGISENLVSKKMKKGITREFDYKEFNDLAYHQDYQGLIQLYQKELVKHPELELNEGMLNMLGLRLSFDPERKQHGINVLKLALHIYPESANLYDSLAEAYLYHKDVENAIANFKKSLELNPENQNAITKLEALEG